MVETEGPAAVTPFVRSEVRRPTLSDTTPDQMVALTNPIYLGAS